MIQAKVWFASSRTATANRLTVVTSELRLAAWLTRRQLAVSPDMTQVTWGMHGDSF